MFEMKMARIPDEPEGSMAGQSIIDSTDAVVSPNSVALAEELAPAETTLAPRTARSHSSTSKRPKQHASPASGAPATPSPAKKKKKHASKLRLNLAADSSASAAVSAVAAASVTPAASVSLSPAASVSRDSLSSAPIPSMSSTDAALIAKLDGDIGGLNAKIRSVQTLQERVRYSLLLIAESHDSRLRNIT